jgi:hypothetical protein
VRAKNGAREHQERDCGEDRRCFEGHGGGLRLDAVRARILGNIADRYPSRPAKFRSAQPNLLLSNASLS